MAEEKVEMELKPSKNDTEKLHLDHANIVETAVDPLRVFLELLEDIPASTPLEPCELSEITIALLEKGIADATAALDAMGKAHAKETVQGCNA